MRSTAVAYGVAASLVLDALIAHERNAPPYDAYPRQILNDMWLASEASAIKTEALSDLNMIAANVLLDVIPATLAACGRAIAKSSTTWEIPRPETQRRHG